MRNYSTSVVHPIYFGIIERRFARKHPEVDMSNIGIGSTVRDEMIFFWIKPANNARDVKRRAIDICLFYARQQIAWGMVDTARQWLESAHRLNHMV